MAANADSSAFAHSPVFTKGERDSRSPQRLMWAWNSETPMANPGGAGAPRRINSPRLAAFPPNLSLWIDPSSDSHSISTGDSIEK